MIGIAKSPLLLVVTVVSSWPLASNTSTVPSVPPPDWVSWPLMVATATSNFMIGVTAAASAIVYYRRGDILVGLAAPLAVGVFLGSLLGARLAPRIHTKYVVYLLVAIMLYLAGHLFVHLLAGGAA